jgi:hypothetical protein
MTFKRKNFIFRSVNWVMLATELEKRFTTPGKALIWYLVLPLVIFFEGITRYQNFFLKFLGDLIPVQEYEQNLIFLL